MSVAPKAIAVSKSALIPIDKDLRPEALGDLGEQREMRRRRLARPAGCTSARRSRGHGRRGSGRRRRRSPPAGRRPSAASAPVLTWTSSRGGRPWRAHLPGERLGEPVAVDGVDRVEQRHRLARLVGLQRPDQVKLDARRRGPAEPATCPWPPAPGSRRRPAVPPRCTGRIAGASKVLETAISRTEPGRGRRRPRAPARRASPRSVDFREHLRLLPHLLLPSFP